MNEKVKSTTYFKAGQESERKRMIKIKEYLIKEKEVSITEISEKFNINTIEAREILDIIGTKIKGE